MPLFILSSIQKQVEEIINRNKGDIKDILNTLNQMILIYSVLAIGNIGYQLQVLDLQDLKTKLQIELHEYNEKINRKKPR